MRAPLAAVVCAVIALTGCSATTSDPAVPSSSTASPSLAVSGGTSGDDAGSTGSTGSAAGAINPAMFGITVNTLASSSGSPLSAGSARLWDVGANWRQVEKSPGACSATSANPNCDWSVLDRAVANATAAGMTDLLYVMGDTPQWAATPASAEVAAGDLYGPGSAAHPADNQSYLAFITAVATRYSDTITSFEAWNEANLTTFYRGTPAQLAQLTAEARTALDAVNPSITLVSASTTVWNSGGFINGNWYLKYLAALKPLGMPIDGYAVHLYPQSPAGPTTRAAMISAVRDAVAPYGDLPLWDTEVNYGDTRPGTDARTFSGATAASYVARTYLDSLRLGVARTYWYSYEIDFLGVRMSDQGVPTSAATAFTTVRSWLSGKTWGGCSTTSQGVFRCRVVDTDGTPTSVWYREQGSAVVSLPPGTASICRLTSRTCSPVAPGSTAVVSGIPVLTRGA